MDSESENKILKDDELEEALEVLTDFILEKTTVPMNHWAVAAILESRGLRDVDAIEIYGKKNIFDLAQLIFYRSKKIIDVRKLESQKKITQVRDKSIQEIFFDYIKYYSEGSVIAIPMTGQIAAIIFLRYSLWAWIDFSELQASLVAIGTITSFVLTGGFMQAIGRESTFYMGQKNPLLLEEVSDLLVKCGVWLITSFCLLSFLVNLIFPYFEIWEISVSLLYCLFLGILWLITAVLFVFNWHLGILIVTLLGTGVVYFLRTYTLIEIYFAHWLGIVTASILGFFMYKFVLKRKKKSKEDKHELSRLPRKSILLFIVEPFIIFGTLYFTFLFADRVIGWSASDVRLPLVIWFRTPYELGMDWALCSLVAIFASLNYPMHQFNQSLIPSQENTELNCYQKHGDQFLKFYRKQTKIIVIVSVLSVMGVYFIASWIKKNFDVYEVQAFFQSDITYFTFWVASLSYSIFAFAQLNALLFFSLSKPKVVIRNISIALICNILSGFLLSRLISYEYSVFGLLLGACVYAYLMRREVILMFKNLDYYYYSAF